MGMQKSAVPNFDETLAAVDPLSNLVYEVMEQATVKTRAFFAEEKQPHDPFLAPCLMRFFAKQGLRKRGIRAEEDEETSDFEALPNNGLAFFHKRHHIRILKAAIVQGVGWKLPGCGVSEPKQEFYNQQLMIYADPKGNQYTSVLNIIYLWDFNEVFNLAGLYLGCPMSAGIYAKDVKHHWCEALPHPAQRRTGEKPPQADNTADEELQQLLTMETEDGEDAKKA
jgi:hypothetical protein